MYSNTFVPIFKNFAIGRIVFKNIITGIAVKVIITFFLPRENEHK